MGSSSPAVHRQCCRSGQIRLSLTSVVLPTPLCLMHFFHREIQSHVSEAFYYIYVSYRPPAEAGGGGAGGGQAGGGGQQQQQQPQQARSPSAGRRIGSVTKNADLDWGEFIERQTRFISVRQAKVAAVAEREYSTKGPSPEVSGRGATAMHTARQSA